MWYALWSLTHVHFSDLAMHGNTITGTIPTWLSVLTQLEYVCVSWQWLVLGSGLAVAWQLLCAVNHVVSCCH